MSSSKRPPPSPRALSSPFERISRRGSVTSQSTSSQIDKEQLAQALDKIHTSASQSGILTTFNDFGPPPPTAAPVADPKGATSDLVQQGLSGFYTRLKEAVGVGVGGKAAATAASASNVTEPDETSSQDGARSKSTLSSLHTRSKSSVSGENAVTNSSLNSTIPSETPVVAALPGGALADNHVQVLPSSRASSVTAASTTAPTPKSSAGNSSLSKPVRISISVVADTASPSSPVGVYQDTSRESGARNVEEYVSPPDGRRKSTRSNEPHHTPTHSTGSSIFDGLVDKRSSISAAASGTLPGKDGLTIDSTDAGYSTAKGAGAYASSLASPTGVSGANPRTARDDLKLAIVNDRVSQGGTPTGSHPLSPGMEKGMPGPSPASTSAHNSTKHEVSVSDARSQQRKSAPTPHSGNSSEGVPEIMSARLEMMRKQIQGKEFWMADETCKECFQCGDPFSAFRRKHHCRTCGWIFDAKCTSTISGQKFGVPGNLRVCKKCLEIINNRHDSDSDDSDDPRLTSLLRSNTQKSTSSAPRLKADDERSMSERTDDAGDGRSTTAPMMAIPATRRIGDPSNRNSAILEIDSPQLSRPSSSRSLKSMASGRPPSSGHVRHNSKHNRLWNFKSNAEDRVPFRKDMSDEMGHKSKLPAFHDDNIIDPVLAPYMPEDESSGDEQMSSIYSTMASKDTMSSSLDPEKSNFGPFLSTGRRHRSRQGEKSISGLSFTSRGVDDGDGSPSVASYSRATGRRRNMSSASVTPGQHHLRSPRSKLGGFKGPSMSSEAFGIIDAVGGLEGPKITRPASSARTEMTRLNMPSIQHTRKLFRQLLDDAAIPNSVAWEKALIPILRKCADEVDPNTREGDRMDIRHYVKLKKIPGGKPSDSSYVSGVIFTKNLALKSMPRRISNPRILIVSFPIEYQRQQEHQFMSLEPVMSQEKEFLKMVVARIRNHEPEVVLAQRNVAGLALQSLAEAGIAVAYNVKPSVIGAVSRFTGTPIISSMDMLSLPITIGRCAKFEVKTFVNNDIPGRKRTYIFVSGCEKFLGCTIALRGMSTGLLSRMKKIIEFMVYVVYNLKLESCLFNDSSVKTSADAEDTATSTSQELEGPKSPGLQTISTATSEKESAATSQSDGGSISRGQEATPPDAEKSRSPPDNLSSSLISLGDEHLQTAQNRPMPEDVPAPTFYSDMVEKYKTKILSASPFVRFTQPYLLMKAREQETRLLYLKRLRDQDIQDEEKGEGEDNKPQQQFQLINPEMVHEIGQKAPRQVMEVLHAVHDAEYDKALYAYQTQTRQWENYIQGNLDLFDPYSHQNIVVLHSVTCTETKIPCLEPELIGISYYNELPDPTSPMSADCTLGQYVQDLCDGAEDLCHANGCDRPMWQHHRTYVHGEARITVFVEPEAKLPSSPEPSSDPDEEDKDDGDTIYMWSYCKSCRRDLVVRRLSSSGWKYSFGKYLELLFWSQSLRLVDDANCPHNCQKEHIRYFNFQGSSVRIHYDPIDLLEVVVPRARLTWKVDHDLKLKNDIFLRMQDRWIRFITSVKNRIKSIRIDSVLPEKAESCKAEVERLAKKAQEEQPRLIRELQQAYLQSKHYEIIPLNAAMRSMAVKITEWDTAFAKFEADFLSDKDVRQLTVMQLRKMFTDNESKESLPATDVPSEAIPTTPATTGTLPSQGSAGETESKPDELLVQTTVSEPLTPLVEGKAADLAPSPEDQATGESTEKAEQAEKLEAAAPNLPVSTKATAEEAKPTTYIDVSVSESTSKPPSTPSAQGPPETPVENTVSSPTTATAPAPAASAVPSRSSQTGGAAHTSQPSLTEKVEQLRREHKVQSSESAGNNSSNDGHAQQQGRHSTEYRGSSRKSGSKGSPQMVRTVSQPIGVGSRTLSGLGKQGSSKDAKGSAAEAGQPMDVLGKVEKKFADRLGLGALKTHRKTGPSAIPRFVHKKKETKVTSLAKQLTREFEKERNRERMQAAKLQNRPRAYFPRSSVKAIVEVYEDINQAVEEPGPTDDEQMFASQHSEGAPRDASASGGTSTGAGAGEASTAPGTVALSSGSGKGAEAAADSKSNETAEASAKTADVSERSRKSSSELPSQQPSQSATEDHEHKHTESAAGSEDEAGSDADQSLEDILPDVETIAEHLEPSGTVPAELQKDKKSNLMKMLGNFWAERSATGWPPLDYPLNASDHIFIDSDVIVREDEPSSLIAFALSSEDYISKLRDIQRQGRRAAQGQKSESEEESGGKEAVKGEEGGGPERRKSKGGEEALPTGDEGAEALADDGASMESESTFYMDESEVERSLLRLTGTHLKYQFTEGSARMMCKIFYAEQFDALRRKCGVADRIIESLSRCLKWDSKGGKTKSVFLKTLDDRLVMKSLSQVETEAFLRFAPSYFRIMAESLFHDLPSVIAKMLGFFQVFVKNTATGTEIKLDLLIMENLFYDRQETRKFDLKGSMRNRRIQSTGEQNEVLLDENMVEYIYESPLFAREHAKKLLRASVWNDTLFLARQNVMDYSLMVAVDESRKELVIGIIDCIRTYTWDKKLESWIKDRGFAGGGRNRPTVTSPKEYKSRFREAMERYILQAPNCWHMFGNTGYTHPALAPRARFEGHDE